jgi:hypothetical protein
MSTTASTTTTTTTTKTTAAKQAKKLASDTISNKFNLDTLNEEQLQELSKVIGQKVKALRKKNDEDVIKSNKYNPGDRVRFHDDRIGTKKKIIQTGIFKGWKNNKALIRAEVKSKTTKSKDKYEVIPQTVRPQMIIEKLDTIESPEIPTPKIIPSIPMVLHQPQLPSVVPKIQPMPVHQIKAPPAKLTQTTLQPALRQAGLLVPHKPVVVPLKSVPSLTLLKNGQKRTDAELKQLQLRIEEEERRKNYGMAPLPKENITQVGNKMVITRTLKEYVMDEGDVRKVDLVTTTKAIDVVDLL